MLTSNNVAYTLVAETGGYKQRILLPYYWYTAPTSRPLVGIQTYNTVSASWEYQGGNAATSLTYWGRVIVSDAVTSYYRYTYNSDNRAETQIRLVF